MSYPYQTAPTYTAYDTYAYSATPGHYIQMPSGPYGSIEIRPLQDGSVSSSQSHQGNYSPGTAYSGSSQE